jgi:hypothetical protein
LNRECPGNGLRAILTGWSGVPFPEIYEKGELKMEKQLGTVAYWIGVVSTVVAIVTRLLTSIGIFLFPLPTPGRVPISYRSFLDGAMLFFVMAIASSVALWVKQQRS